MPYYDQPPQDYHRSRPPPSFSRSNSTPLAGKYNFSTYDTPYASYSRREDRSLPSHGSSTRSHSFSALPSKSSRTTTRREQRRDEIAKIGIVAGTLAVVAGTMHLLSTRERRHADQQAEMQRERQAALAKRERRRRKEEEEERQAEEEERQRDEYDEWVERGRRGVYIDYPQPGGGASNHSQRTLAVGDEPEES